MKKKYYKVCYMQTRENDSYIQKKLRRPRFYSRIGISYYSSIRYKRNQWTTPRKDNPLYYNQFLFVYSSKKEAINSVINGNKYAIFECEIGEKLTSLDNVDIKRFEYIKDVVFTDKVKITKRIG